MDSVVYLQQLLQTNSLEETQEIMRDSGIKAVRQLKDAGPWLNGYIRRFEKLKNAYEAAHASLPQLGCCASEIDRLLTQRARTLQLQTVLREMDYVSQNVRDLVHFGPFYKLLKAKGPAFASFVESNAQYVENLFRVEIPDFQALAALPGLSILPQTLDSYHSEGSAAQPNCPTYPSQANHLNQTNYPNSPDFQAFVRERAQIQAKYNLLKGIRADCRLLREGLLAQLRQSPGEFLGDVGSLQRLFCFSDIELINLCEELYLTPQCAAGLATLSDLLGYARNFEADCLQPGVDAFIIKNGARFVFPQRLSSFGDVFNAVQACAFTQVPAVRAICSAAVFQALAQSQLLSRPSVERLRVGEGVYAIYMQLYVPPIAAAPEHAVMAAQLCGCVSAGCARAIYAFVVSYGVSRVLVCRNDEKGGTAAALQELCELRQLFGDFAIAGERPAVEAVEERARREFGALYDNLSGAK